MHRGGGDSQILFVAQTHLNFMQSKMLAFILIVLVQRVAKIERRTKDSRCDQDTKCD